MSGCCSQRFDKVFGDRTAAHDLRRYRKRGPAKPTRRLLSALRAEGVADASVLDIGGGVGAIQLELLAAGAGRATAVEGSAAYLRAAAEEARRRAVGERVEQREGDFVRLAGEIPPADIVTLDRVVCCYPDAERLVGASAEKARRLYGLVYPRRAWWTRLGFAVTNLGMRVARRDFRVFAHPPATIDAAATGAGLRLLHRGAGPIWTVALYGRANRPS